MTSIDDADLPPEEEQLLKLLVAYDESLQQGSPAEGVEPTLPDLPSHLADQLSRSQRMIDLLAALQTSGKWVSPTPPVDDESLSVSLETLWQAVPHGGEALPHHLGRFMIQRELGRGGHGVVLLAVDPILKRQLALKLPRPENIMSPSLHRRFMREARATAQLTHPNLIAVYEVGEIGPVCYIASAYCAGPTLAAWFCTHGSAISPHQAAHIVKQLAVALQYAHEHNILHRDLKPSNVLLEPLITTGSTATAPSDHGLNFVPKITDFGLAKFVSDPDEGTWTHAGTTLGTPAYMSPEQAEGRLQDIGPPTDVYALGAILYEISDSRAGLPGRERAGNPP